MVAWSRLDAEELAMPDRKKPGEIADRPGEYGEISARGGKVPNRREVTIDPGDKMSPTKKPGREWERIGPRKREMK